MKIIDKRNSLRRHPTKRYNTRNKSQIKYIAIHHSASTSGTVEGFANYHVNNLGWAGIGYHYVIDKQGIIYLCNDLETISYHVGNSNSAAVGICMIGDFTKEKPTVAQYQAALQLTKMLMSELNISSRNVLGHREFPNNSTSCPAINMNQFRQDVAKTLGGNSTVSPTVAQATTQRVLRLTSPLMYGEDVKQLQSNLNKFGYNLKIDGYYGNDTVNVVRHFQQKYSLTVDGIAGNQVFSKINELLKQQSQPKTQPTQNNNIKGDDDKLKITQWQWDMLYDAVKELLNKKVITDENWLNKAKSKNLTISELTWLNSIAIQRLMK